MVDLIPDVAAPIGRRPGVTNSASDSDNLADA
jgi:hypothetical protein